MDNARAIVRISVEFRTMVRVPLEGIGRCEVTVKTLLELRSGEQY